MEIITYRILTGIIAGASNNSKQWFEGISIILQADDKQAKDPTGTYPGYGDHKTLSVELGNGCIRVFALE